jgi:sulfur relay protein TusB/DsrH
MRRSQDARLYLCGDGVYCLLDDLNGLLPSDLILACAEDVTARGISGEIAGIVLQEFYDRLIEDVLMSENVYSF